MIFLRVFLLAGLLSHATWAQYAIDGRVQTISAQSLGGATVTLLNTDRGTVTNADGSFQLNNVAKGQYTLSISSVGYATQTRPIAVNGP